MARRANASAGGTGSAGGAGASGRASRRGRAPAEGDRIGIPVPGWLPPALFAAVTLFLFRSFVFSDEMLFGSDTLSLGYVARAFFAGAVREGGSFPLWNPTILGGTPFVESLAGGDALYPTSLLLFVMETYRALGWKLVIHVFLAGLFMFGWIRGLGLSRAAALLAGLAYTVAPFMVTLVYPGHDGKLFVTALTPLLFWASERSLVRPTLLSWVWIAGVVALVIYTTHFQTAYFLFGAAGAYYLFRTAQVWRRGGEGEGGGKDAEGVARGARPALTRLGLFLLAALLGAGAAAVQLVPAVDYVTEFSRRTATTVGARTEQEAVEYSSSWSLHPEEIGGLVVPEFVGSNVRGAAWATDTYWGRNPFKHNHEYAGLVVLVLAGLSFFGGRRRGVRWFLVGLGGLTLLYALGSHTPVWRLFYEVVPGVSLFRAPSIAAFLFGFPAITLAAFGFDRGVEAARGDEDAWRGPWRWLWIGAAALLALAMLAASGALTAVWTGVLYRDAGPFSLQALERARPFITRGFLVAAVLAGATAGVFWALRRGFLNGVAAVAALAVLVAVDGIRVDAPFIQTVDHDRYFTPDENQRYLMGRQAAEAPFRVFSMLGSGQDVTPALYGLELAAGHHPNDLARYRELIGMRGSGVPENLGQPNVLRILNVRYLVWPGPEVLPGREPVSALTYADGTVHSAVYPYPGLPRARLVAEATVLPDAEAVPYILSDAFRPETEVVLAEPPPLELGGGPVSGTVEWEEREPNVLRLSVESDRPALLVLAENHFPAWEARVDGEPVPVLRANHALRAVPVPEGRHTVEMTYDSTVLRASLWITLAVAGLLAAAAAYALVQRRRARPPEPAGP